MGPVASAGSFPAEPPPTAHQGQAGLSLPGCGVPAGSSITTGPCDVQITTGSAAAARLAAWTSARPRTNGCAATVREITSSRNVCNPARRRRMRHASYIPAAKAMAGAAQLGEFKRRRDLCRPPQCPDAIALATAAERPCLGDPPGGGTARHDDAARTPTSALLPRLPASVPRLSGGTAAVAFPIGRRLGWRLHYDSRLLRPGPTQQRPFQTAPSSTNSCSVKSALAVSAFK